MKYLIYTRNSVTRFSSLDAAKAYAQRVFERTGVIVAIVETKPARTWRIVR